MAQCLLLSNPEQCAAHHAAQLGVVGQLSLQQLRAGCSTRSTSVHGAAELQHRPLKGQKHAGSGMHAPKLYRSPSMLLCARQTSARLALFLHMHQLACFAQPVYAGHAHVSRHQQCVARP